MRWHALLADLAGQAERMDQAERSAEVADRARIEAQRVTLVDRLRAVGDGNRVRVQVRGCDDVTGRIRQVAVGWTLVSDDSGAEWIITAPAIMGVAGLHRYSEPAGSSVVDSRLGIAHALRGIAADRSGVRILMTDGSVVDGTIDRVGADFVDVAVHPAGEARRRSTVREMRAVALAGVAAVVRSDR